MMKSKIGMGCLLMAVALASACTRSSSSSNSNQDSRPSAPTATSVLPSDNSPKRAPAVVEVRGPAQVAPHSEFNVEVVLLRRTSFDKPVTLTVKLPPGVELVAGSLAETITDPGTESITRSLRVRVGEIPEQDIVAEADGRSASSGYHSKNVWGFGRPTRKLVPPTTAPKPIVVRGRNIGHPVVMN